MASGFEVIPEALFLCILLFDRHNDGCDINDHDSNTDKGEGRADLLCIEIHAEERVAVLLDVLYQAAGDEGGTETDQTGNGIGDCKSIGTLIVGH